MKELWMRGLCFMFHAPCFMCESFPVSVLDVLVYRVLCIVSLYQRQRRMARRTPTFNVLGPRVMPIIYMYFFLGSLPAPPRPLSYTHSYYFRQYRNHTHTTDTHTRVTPTTNQPPPPSRGLKQTKIEEKEGRQTDTQMKTDV
jgi:hypothetical protein